MAPIGGRHATVSEEPPDHFGHQPPSIRVARGLPCGEPRALLLLEEAKPRFDRDRDRARPGLPPRHGEHSGSDLVEPVESGLRPIRSSPLVGQPPSGNIRDRSANVIACEQ